MNQASDIQIGLMRNEPAKCSVDVPQRLLMDHRQSDNIHDMEKKNKFPPVSPNGFGTFI